LAVSGIASTPVSEAEKPVTAPDRQAANDSTLIWPSWQALRMSASGVHLTSLVGVFALIVGIGEILLECTNSEARKWGRAIKFAAPIGAGSAAARIVLTGQEVVTFDDSLSLVLLSATWAVMLRASQEKPINFIRPPD
jgi:hypothetical protein